MGNSISAEASGKSAYSAKIIVRGLLDQLPDDCTLEDVMLELYVRASIIESRQQIVDGRGLSMAAAKEELDEWFKSRSLQSSSVS